MNIIDIKKIYKSATWLNTDFPVLIMDDFISEELTTDLVKDASYFLNFQSRDIEFIHGGRKIMPWTSLEFNDLLSTSKNWELFSKMFKYDSFKIFKEKLNKCNISSPSSLIKINDLYNSILTDFEEYKLTTKLLNKKFLNNYRQALDKKIKYYMPNKLIIIALLKLIDNNWRRIKSFINLFQGKKPLIPLFDYSFAKKGYNREIHRDSDNRVLVALLYLNNLEEGCEGGDLEIYKLKNNDLDDSNYPPHPLPIDCELQYKVKPRRGRLILFLNQHNSYHAVSKMNDSSTGRHFIYGGFTVPSSILISKRNSKSDSSKTELNLY